MGDFGPGYPTTPPINCILRVFLRTAYITRSLIYITYIWIKPLVPLAPVGRMCDTYVRMYKRVRDRGGVRTARFSINWKEKDPKKE